MASLSHLDAPGAYPDTPTNEEPTHQHHHNKLHKREDPRGASNTVSQQQYPVGYNSAGSGIHKDETSFAHDASDPTSSFHNPSRYTSLNTNKETPRNLGNDTQHKGHRFTDSGIDVDDSSLSGKTAGPGVVTGAYSRVGTRDSAFAPISDYTYDKASSQPQHPVGSAHGVDTQTARAAGLVTPAKPPTESANLDLNNSIGVNDHAGHRHEAQSGLREDPNAKHEPYWGDLPFGAGVYNGVTGHGSNESTTHQKSSHDRFGTTTTNTGVYNGVTGHGSNGTTSTQMPIRSRDAAMKDPSHEQRAFPLTNDANTTTAANPNSSGKHGRDSRMKEMLAGAGATAAGGYAAHEYLNRDENKKAGATGGRLEGEKLSKSGQSKLDATSSSPSNKKNESFVHKSEAKENLAPKPLFTAAAPAEAIESEKLDKEPAGTENENPLFTSAAPAEIVESETLERKPTDTENEKDKKGKSDVGYFGAAAAVAAAGGAGAYGAHEHAKRESSKEHSSASKNKALSSTAPRDTARESARDNNQWLSNNGPDQAASHKQPQSSMLAAGTAAGIAGSSANQSHNTSGSGPPHSSVPSDSPSSGLMTGRRKATEHSSADPSHGGQYNVLSSGTPSGINIDQTHSSQQHHRHEEQQPSKLSQAPLTSQTHPAHERQTQRGGDPSLQAAAVPLPGEKNNKTRNHEPMKKERDCGKDNSRLGAAALGAGAVGAGALMAGGSAPGQKVTHRCTKCGEENDISAYVMI
ncbi:hypothetical protein F5Y10DRAFT_5293 [Nemania abortiva]|nr:hypothetical protein F5Y10DRAFT_5293 [Nemania abortiva]